MDVYVAGVVVYILVLVTIAGYKMRRVKTQDDFMVAGRNASALFLAGTLVTTWIGSGSLFGGAGLAFRMGISQLWMSAGAWVGIAIVFFLAHKVRRISQYTVSDILEKRYNAAARLLGTTAIIIAYLTIAGYQFRGAGRLLNILTGIDPVMGGAITCAVVILFTVLAGLVSILSIDLINGIIMTLGVLIALPLAFFAIGPDQITSLPADRFTAFGSNNAVWAMGVFFPTFFLLLGESSMYQKFFAARDEATARRAVAWMIVGVVIVETALALLAVVGSAKYLSLAPFALADGSIDKATSETIVLHLARFDIPQFAGVLLICAGVAIILSTANTFLMIPSTNIARDIYQRFIRPDVSQETIIWFQRFWIVILGIVAFVLANFFQSILDMAFTAYTMVGAGITPALLAAFLWKRVTVAGGVASIGSGMGVTLVITICNFLLEGPLMETDYIILPAAATSLAALILVSLMTPSSPEEKWKPFMQNMKM
ncbi:MAG: sodium:solute symporter family protein [Ignavibacteriales bacterium]|nr:sodium:solute symporter family protein [Ignavibacteriales bacterium]